MSSPKPITNAERDEAIIEGMRRREEYISKHPRGEAKAATAPSGWDEPMKPKGIRRRK